MLPPEKEAGQGGGGDKSASLAEQACSRGWCKVMATDQEEVNTMEVENGDPRTVRWQQGRLYEADPRTVR